jgi:tetratricopeptide (TPR) repeat protein
VVAQHAAGLAALRSGSAGRAVKHLEAAAALSTGRRARAIRCDLALAAVASGERAAALRRLRQVDDGPCPFPGQASTQAVPILIAFTEGLSARRAGAALARLEALDRRASGAAKQLLATATRVIAINAASQAYRRGQLRQARRYLAQARKVEVEAAGDELAHNQAVLDVADGRINTARAALDKLTPRVPEALVNLGVAYERQGEPEKALEAWQRARKSGVRFAPLAGWIEAKERIYGDGTGGEQ